MQEPNKQDVPINNTTEGQATVMANLPSEPSKQVISYYKWRTMHHKWLNVLMQNALGEKDTLEPPSMVNLWYLVCLEPEHHVDLQPNQEYVQWYELHIVVAEALAGPDRLVQQGAGNCRCRGWSTFHVTTRVGRSWRRLTLPLEHVDDDNGGYFHDPLLRVRVESVVKRRMFKGIETVRVRTGIETFSTI